MQLWEESTKSAFFHHSYNTETSCWETICKEKELSPFSLCKLSLRSRRGWLFKSRVESSSVSLSRLLLLSATQKPKPSFPCQEDKVTNTAGFPFASFFSPPNYLFFDFPCLHFVIYWNYCSFHTYRDNIQFGIFASFCLY
ncbi:UNVERIFIED_CONTAM: hypothetical protein K2H54_021381 [Gekko kuhli]